VPLLLRKIRKERWRTLDNAAWVPRGDIPGDPLGDLVTQNNRLSIWVVDAGPGNLDRVLCALAGNCDKLSHVDYLLFDEGVLGELQLKMETKPGDTPDTEANARWHREIIELSAGKLASLARRMYVLQRFRLHWKDVSRLLKEAVETNRLDSAKLKKKLRSDLDLAGSS
jgi:hypothetical protein